MSRVKPNSCVGCSLHSHGTDFSRVDGTGALGVLIVAEASGEHEAREGVPLVSYAPAGSLLQRTFQRMGLDRAQFSLTNCIRCRPRNNWLEGAPWEYSALRHCRPNLDAAIADRRPRAILTLGGVPLRELTGMAGDAQGISHLSGYVLPTYMKVPEPCTESDCIVTGKAMPNCFMCGGTGVAGEMNAPAKDAIPIIPAFHPAFIRRGKAAYQGFFSRNLQRAINVAAGRDRQWIWDLEGAKQNGQLRYQTHPSLDDARNYLCRIRASEGQPISYDLETFESASLDEDARDGFVDTRIRLVQFYTADAGGIAFPWEGEYRSIASAILRTPHIKCGHNAWLFDNKVLRAVGEREGLDLLPRGTVHDTLQMFHHWQPDLPAHLQFAAQFVQFPFPWKHLAGSDLEFYGCVDVDATLQLYNFLVATMQRDEIWGSDGTQIELSDGAGAIGSGTTASNPLGYLGQVAAVRPVLAAMEDRGLPVDDDERLRLDEEFKLAELDLSLELMPRFPESAKKLDPYKKFPPELKKLPESEWGKLFQEPDKLDKRGRLKAGKWYRYGQREVPEPIIGEDGEPTTVLALRWCYIPEFNPNSGKMLIAYMKAKGHKVPKSKETDDEGNEKDTTNKKELLRLSSRHADNFYIKTIEYRELSKMRGTYIEGFKPHADGCAHTTFTFDTGTGQLTSRNPNIQNFPKHARLAKAVRRMIAAPEGYVIVEADYKAYHVLTTGFCAEDADYMRFARLDMHSYVAGHFLHVWDADRIRSETDAELRERFTWFKQDITRKRVRDKQAKPSILGIGFGMGYRRLYQENLEHFTGEKQAKQFHDLLRHLFPKVFEWQDRIRKQAHEQTYLKSPFGHIRRFYEVYRWDNKKGGWQPGDQAEEAVAFLPANLAFGNIRECLKEQRRLGLDTRYGLCNNVHDSFVYIFERERVHSFLQEVVQVLRQPSKVLIHPVLAPKGLTVDVEVSVGQNWAEMSEIKVGEAHHETHTAASIRPVDGIRSQSGDADAFAAGRI